MRSVIVLAGGKGERFQVPGKALRDKALTKLDGTTFLEKIVETGIQIADEVIISTDSQERGRKYREILEKRFKEFKIFIDEASLPVKGPLLGLTTSLKYCQGTRCVTVPVDAPFMKVGVLESLFKLGAGWDVAVPVWSNGKIEPLIAYYDKKQVFEAVKATCILSKGRAADSFRGTSKALYVHVNEFREVDSRLESFVNINHPSDLKIRRTTEVEGKLESSVSFETKKLDFNLMGEILNDVVKLNTENAFSLISKINHEFWRANLLKALAEKTKETDFYIRSGEVFLLESKRYRQKKISFQELHALIDSDEAFEKAGKSLSNLGSRIDLLFRQLGIIKDERHHPSLLQANSFCK